MKTKTNKLITLSTSAKCRSYIKDHDLSDVYIFNRAPHTWEVWAMRANQTQGKRYLFVYSAGGQDNQMYINANNYVQACDEFWSVFQGQEICDVEVAEETNNALTI